MPMISRLIQWLLALALICLTACHEPIPATMTGGKAALPTSASLRHNPAGLAEEPPTKPAGSVSTRRVQVGPLIVAYMYWGPALAVTAYRIAPIITSRTYDLFVLEVAPTASLATNMIRTMRIWRPFSTQAHHIVPPKMNRGLAPECRNIIQNTGLSLNSVANGVFLPKEYHQKLHTIEYFKRLHELLQDVKTKEEAISALNKARDEILFEVKAFYEK